MKLLRILICGAMSLATPNAFAANGEMGTGVPTFGIYTQAPGLAMQISVWSLANPTTPMAAGCGSLVLTPATMGLDSFKMAMATLTAAKVAGMRVRFYAHIERDGGCGVDYVQLND